MLFNRRLFIEKVSKVGILTTLSIPAVGTNLSSVQDKEEGTSFFAGS